MTSSFVSEDTSATTPATPAADGDAFSQQPSVTNDSSEDHIPTLGDSQGSVVCIRVQNLLLMMRL